MVSVWAASLGQPVAVSTDLNGALRADRFRGRFTSGELGCHWEMAVSLGDASFQGQEGYRNHFIFILLLIRVAGYWCHICLKIISFLNKKEVLVWSWRKISELWSALTDAGNSYQCPAYIPSRPHCTFSHQSETPPISLSSLREFLRK